MNWESSLRLVTNGKYSKWSCSILCRYGSLHWPVTHVFYLLRASSPIPFPHQLFQNIYILLLLCFYVQLHPTFCDPPPLPRTVACQALLSIGFSRQEYWSGLPFPSPGDLPESGIKPTSLVSPALAGRFLPWCHLGSPLSLGKYTELEHHLIVSEPYDPSKLLYESWL